MEKRNAHCSCLIYWINVYKTAKIPDVSYYDCEIVSLTQFSKALRDVPRSFPFPEESPKFISLHQA